MAKIKIVFVDTDTEYLSRVSDYFVLFHGMDFEVAVFSGINGIAEYVGHNTVHCMIVANVLYTKELADALNRSIKIVRLEDGNPFDDVKLDSISTEKYQSMEKLIKVIKSVAAEVVPSIASVDGVLLNQILVFDAVSGGCGTTSLALALGMNLAQRGKRTLYLNFENVGDISSFVPDSKGKGLAEMLYQCKSGKGNFEMKFDGVVRSTESGMDFLAPCARFMDVTDLSDGDVDNLLESICAMGRYSYIVIDKTFGNTKMSKEFIKKSDRVFYVSDGTEKSNNKVLAAIAGLELLDQKNRSEEAKKISVVYNKFHKSSSKKMEGHDGDLDVGFPYIESSDPGSIVRALSGNENMKKMA